MAALELNPRIYKRYQKRTLKYLMVPEKDTEVPNIFNMNNELVGDVTSDPQQHQPKIQTRTSKAEKIV